MKKLIYCACAALLTVACTEEELIQQGVETGSHGITFAATLAEGADDATRGAFEVENGKGHFFWYAEEDRMSVYADNVTGGSANGVVTDWASLPAKPAAYKATKSERQGQFTAVDDANKLSFQNNNKANFVALYPSSTTLSAATTAAGAISDVTLSIGANATQNVPFNAVAAPMYSISQGARNADYHSVGEKMNVSFKRPFPVVMLTSAEGNDKYFEDYEDYIGGLNSVTLTMVGAAYKDKNGADQTFKSVVGSSTAVTWNKNNNNLTGVTEGAVTVTVPTDVWNSEDNIYMSILPATRNNVKCDDGNVRSFEEAYTLTYAFENITLVKNVKTTKDWNEGHSLYKLPALDIAKDFPYIVTNSGRTLIVFSGKFEQIYHKTDGAVDGIAWNNGKVNWAEITTIIVEDGVTMTDADLQGLDRFSALTTLELNGITNIPANTFDGTLVTTLTTLNLPDVTGIVTKDANGNAVQNAFTKLANLYLNSYEFKQNNGAEKLFFNSDVKTTLVELNIEAVKDFKVSFGYDYSMSFEGYAKLESVTLNATEVALLGSAFKGCVELEEIIGKVDITNAPNVFEGTTSLAEVDITGTIIPKQAFKGSAIEDILVGGKQVVPTEIQEEAFMNATALELMDLENATTIGKKAFLGASAFIGADATVNNVLNVGAAVINDQVLAGTAVKRVQFLNATSVDRLIFNSCSALEQVKFLKVFTATDEWDLTTANNPFYGMNAANVDLFVNPAQTTIDGYSLTLTNNYNGVGSSRTYAFKYLKREEGRWTK